MAFILLNLLWKLFLELSFFPLLQNKIVKHKNTNKQKKKKKKRERESSGEIKQEKTRYRMLP